MHDYKSLLCLGDYKEDTYYIVLSTGDLKKSVTHKASKSKIFLSSIIGYHVLGFALFKSIESNEVLSIYLLCLFPLSFRLLLRLFIIYVYLNTEFEKVEFTRAEFNGFKKQVKKHNKTIVLFTLLFIVMFSFSMFLYLSRPSIFLLLVMNYVVCFSYLFYTNGFFTKRFHFEEYINKNFLKGG